MMKLARRSLKTMRMMLERMMVMMVNSSHACTLYFHYDDYGAGWSIPYTAYDDINERTTRSRSRNTSHFAHSAFVATFEPKDIGHALSDPNWVNAMHEELENFERN
jgi:hypothetical protein